MNERGSSDRILMADDDPDDRMMAAEAFKECHLANDVAFVEDGVELMDYLLHRGRYSDPKTSPEPGLILLDLNMPRKDGREALVEIKSNERLRRIPVVVLTTSRAEEDVRHLYELGANSYITKPTTFHDLADTLRTLSQYWFGTVQLPSDATSG